MVKMINAFTGTEMYVDESRVLEYARMGHKKCPDFTPVYEKIKEEEKPAKKTVKKTTRKKA